MPKPKRNYVERLRAALRHAVYCKAKGHAVSGARGGRLQSRCSKCDALAQEFIVGHDWRMWDRKQQSQANVIPFRKDKS